MRERFKKLLFVRYLIAGGIAGVTQLILLYAFTKLLHIHYLISTSVAFFIVFWISFFLQKLWTFAEKTRHRINKQVVYYFVMHSVNFFANGFLMYVFVSLLGIWYIVSQIIISLSIAGVTYFINKKYIFVQIPIL